MDTGRNDLLGEIAADAALERSDFLVQSTDQFRRFLEANRSRIDALGGLTLIDEDPDYLSIAPDLTFRSRTRYIDDLSGEWTSETEVIESAAEVVELYNPADLYSAFAEAAREAAGLREEPTAAADMLEDAGIGVDESMTVGADPYAAAADDWAAGQPAPLDADDDELAAQRLYDLALDYQERSQRSESRLLEQFEEAAGLLTARIGDLIITDDDDERLTLTASGEFAAEVLTEEENEWRRLGSADEMVEYYDPTDVFGDLADALAEAYPAIASDVAAADATNGTGGEAEADAEAELEGEEVDEADEAAEEDEPRA
jgi:transcription elongation factor Elf1